LGFKGGVPGGKDKKKREEQFAGKFREEISRKFREK